jgi:hypothetical protein
MNKCKQTKNLIDQIIDFDSEDHAVINEHANTCEDCTAYLLAAQQVNQDLQFMTDADDSLVDSTLASILSLQENVEVETLETTLETHSQTNSQSDSQSDSKEKRSYWLKPQWANALAASFMFISLIALFPYNSISNFGLAPEIMESSNEQLSDDYSRAKLERKEERKEERQKDGPEERFESPYDKEFSVDLIEVEMDEMVSLKKRMIPKKPSMQILNLTPAPPKMSVRETVGQYANKKGNYQVVTQNMPSPLSPMQDLSKIDLGLKQPDLIVGSISQEVSDFSDEQDDREKLDKVTVTGSRIRSPQLETPNPVYSRDLSELVSAVKKSATSNTNSAIVAEELEVLEEIVVTGSHIKRSDLEPPNPVSAFKNRNSRNYVDTRSNLGGKKLLESIKKHEQKKQLNEKSISIQEDKDELDSISVTGSRIKSSDIDGPKPVIVISREEKSRFAKEQMRKDGGLITFEDIPSSEKPNKKEKSKLQAKVELIGNSISNTEANNYLAQLQSLENITYKNSSGYWANTYLPGDSQMRLIHTKLLQDKAQGQEVLASISPNIQPFDAPTNSAMAVYLSSDHAVLQSQQPTRMRLQVGLQASQRKGGHRSAMNIGLIYDTQATQADKPTQIKKLKALLSALLQSKQAGDRISLTVTGSEGGLVISSNQFRHGPIQVALNKLLNADESESISLIQALKIAAKHTMKTDDPSASLGSSLLILISDKTIGDKTISDNTINSLVHNNAVNGMPLSTVSLNAINQNQLSQLALTGQGHARILQSTDDAKRIIDEELLVSSRAVARALRLKIRLAKGVKLINVIDSYNLNESQAQRVRDAEQSLDQRLSKNLGITADRGEDEEGIQIVIPSFYAGDTHVILLDVVVTNTGPIADVTMRYKDLLYLNNAVTRKQLTMDNNPKELGPLNFNVIKNILAKRFSNDIQTASQLLKNGNKDQALKKLIKLQKLYQSMRVQFPNWKDDAEIFNDQKLLKKYIKLLQSLSLDQNQQISFVIDSLQYISWRKSTTTPM